MRPEQTTWLEEACDEVNADAAAAEVVRAARRHPGGRPPARLPHRLPARGAAHDRLRRRVNRECVRYLNRLSDLLFILSRGANAGDEPLWEPGLYR